jgi:hypothetical protein
MYIYIYTYSCIYTGNTIRSPYGNFSSILNIPEISKNKISVCKNNKNYKNLIIISKEIRILEKLIKKNMRFINENDKICVDTNMCSDLFMNNCIENEISS